MRIIIRSNITRHIDHYLRYQWTAESSSQRIDTLIERIGENGRRNEKIREVLSSVDNSQILDAGRLGICAQKILVDPLAHVYCDADGFEALFPQVNSAVGRIKSAGVTQYYRL